MNAIDKVTERHDLAGYVGDIERLESVFAGWDSPQSANVAAYRQAIEALNAEAIRRLIRALKTEPAALAALKTAAADEIVYAVLRRHEIIKPSLAERVEAALESVRPMLATHGGDIELLNISAPAIEVRFLGACDGCPASVLTFHAGVKTAVQSQCPEITEIREKKGSGGIEQYGRFASPFAAEWLFACNLADIPQSGVLALQAGGEKLLLTRHAGGVKCFANACAHLGLPLDAGAVRNGIITCPHHEFQYNLATGECLTAPVALRPYQARLTGNAVEIRLVG
jgi:nitrite reductase/ring-hydroxylating ferredoxin subunit/Fe-S cluster biogenesis protein NfuA